MLRIDYWYNDNANAKIVKGMQLITEGCKENNSRYQCDRCPFRPHCEYGDIPSSWRTKSITTQRYDKATATFYPNEGIWRGNVYKGSQIVGDFVCDDSVELERKFPGIFG